MSPSPKNVLIFAIIIVAFAIFSVSTASAAYANCKNHVIYGSPDGALVNYQIPITFYNTTNFTYNGSECYLSDSIKSTSFYDIKINGSYSNGTDNGHTFPMWVESYGPHSAKVWVNVTDTIPQSGTYILKIYYNDSSISTSPYDGTKTFTLFDDFTGASVNSTMWTTLAGSSATVSGGAVAITATSVDGIRGIYTKTEFGRGYAFRTNMKSSVVGSTSNQWTQIDFMDDMASPTYDVGAQISQSGGNQGLTVWVNGQDGVLHTTTAMAANTYSVLEIGRLASKSTLTINDSNKVEDGNIVPGSSTASWRLASRKSGAAATPTLTVDWAVLRAFTANEPVQGAYYNDGYPLADFTVNTTEAWIPMTVSFTDTSLGNPTSWEWDFGDGTSSTEQNPTHTYTSGGVYTVNLTVSTANGEDTDSKANLITARAPVKFILDTDMSEDCGDLAALAGCNYMMNQGECELLAVIINSANPYSAPAADAVNNWYYRDIPVGQWQGADPNPSQGASHSDWTQAVAESFGKSGLTRANYSDSTTLYRQILANQSDHSVIISAIGFGNTLQALMNSPADGISPMTGRELIAAKVIRLDFMGGAYPTYNDGDYSFGGAEEFNFRCTIAAWQDVLANWPTPMIAQGFEVGDSIHTEPPRSYDPDTNPIRKAYYEHFGSTLEGQIGSWDILGAVYTVRDFELGSYIVIAGSDGNITCANDGHSAWSQSPDRNMSYIESVDDEGIEPILNAMLEAEPETPTDPVANFTFTYTPGYSPQTVNFTDTSENWPRTWQWNFGDETANSTVQNPSHVYSTPGNYTVMLTITNFNGTSTFAQENCIEVLVPTPTPVPPTPTPPPTAKEMTDDTVNTSYQLVLIIPTALIGFVLLRMFNGDGEGFDSEVMGTIIKIAALFVAIAIALYLLSMFSAAIPG